MFYEISFKTLYYVFIILAIGIVPEAYPENLRLGYGKRSIGYHADGGVLYHGNKSGEKVGPKCNVGDRIGCGISFQRAGGMWGLFSLYDYFAVFTRNGRMIGQKVICTVSSRFLAVGMHSAGEKVKVILDAKMPGM
ncbi:SPRY domain-containing protein 3-like [Mercenaria mercenaria]|uniref:SPRY domain-containing protein 3-like n=1 Tax=Mercenaria mercenaria TaxID=6596 RepID=UPI00234EC647|nr:SPRY domain-containing protein 3-like [Mercenaria mercenaria]